MDGLPEDLINYDLVFLKYALLSSLMWNEAFQNIKTCFQIIDTDLRSKSR